MIPFIWYSTMSILWGIIAIWMLWEGEGLGAIALITMFASMFLTWTYLK